MVLDHLRNILADVESNDPDYQKKLTRIKESANSALGLSEEMQQAFEQRIG